MDRDKTKELESGYNSDKIQDESPIKNRVVSPDMHVDDSGVPSPAVGMLCASPLGSIETSPLSDVDGINSEGLYSHVSHNQE